eukprot:CAMPEP_0185569988 /NCGR_PEP_ID=MMETSP0434-20130131/2448_1 /TAXON_ID=626734 ORGANISM="Favella taraikaensis, Strain Fe Narragansett Bay" /NCGR_SAMPLE_ID=MMETSP0434 /ASSEMBLY_ACC=CAM_ASM_000379 /LENGTH=97 /DNA_ID=CAMNT_0028184969 /DNA_START=250 /DNA_END=543 /DNA_ORIENTATION=+
MKSTCDAYRDQFGDFVGRRTLLDICEDLFDYFDTSAIPNRCLSFEGPARTRADINPDTTVESCASGCASNGVCLPASNTTLCSNLKPKWKQDRIRRE